MTRIRDGVVVRWALGAIVAAAALAGCAGTPADETEEGAAGPPAKPPVASMPGNPPAGAGAAAPTPAAPPTPPVARAPAASASDFARTLEAAERRIDDLARAGSLPDAEAAQRREEVESAVEAFAREYADRLLAGAADASDPAHRVACVKVLGYSNDRRATRVAVAALQVESDRALQTAAGFALSRLRDPDTDVAVLVQAARSPDVDVRVNALLAMSRVLEARGGVGNFLDVGTREQVLPVLETALFDTEDPSIRGWAACAARHMGDPRILPSLLNLLRDKNPFVRAQTALAVGQYGTRTELDPLLAVIDDTPAGPARTAVLTAITRILSRMQIQAPRDIADDQTAWTSYVRRELSEQDRRPVR
jgi:HEAT repeat protein